ncbi:MAG: hypothetical protein HZB99_00990 [Candidatus Harrisonbacteria bacterium]|nr:hypothetical protein [Candidatus Harrisonbacteria bacterium]
MNNFIKKIKGAIKSFLKDPLFLRRWEESWYSRHRDDNQLSVRISGRHRRKAYPYHGDSFMFIEDMYTGIMPFMIYRGEREKYPARIEPATTPQRQRLIASGISQRDHTHFLEDAICEFVRTTAHILFSDGVAFYEIVYKKNEAGEIESFDFELLQPFYLFRFWKNYYQIVPWWEAKESHIRVQIIKIPAEKILRIDFPKQYGGKRKVYYLLKRLYQLSKELIPKFQIDSMGKNENIGFDLNEFSRVKYLEIAKLTKEFGWNQRQRSDNYITEYYSMERFLREKKLEATIRAHILKKLNETLNRAPLNLGAKIAMDNLFSIEDVEKQEKLLKEGNVKFMDIFNALKT